LGHAAAEHLDVIDLVSDALAGIAAQFLAEIAHHFRRAHGAQRAIILARKRILHFGQPALEHIEIGIGDLVAVALRRRRTATPPERIGGRLAVIARERIAAQPAQAVARHATWRAGWRHAPAAT